jgi:NADH-quinone oxidoreductase subunit N
MKRPLLGVTMAFFMFSLSGFPPLAGFIGKVRVFAPAVEAGLTWLVIIGVLTSAISAFYYLRVLFVMFMQEADEKTVGQLPQTVSLAFAAVLVVCALSQLWFGIMPSGILDVTDSFFSSGAMAVLP